MIIYEALTLTLSLGPEFITLLPTALKWLTQTRCAGRSLFKCTHRDTRPPIFFNLFWWARAICFPCAWARFQKVQNLQLFFHSWQIPVSWLYIYIIFLCLCRDTLAFSRCYLDNFRGHEGKEKKERKKNIFSKSGMHVNRKKGRKIMVKEYTSYLKQAHRCQCAWANWKTEIICIKAT